MSQLPLHPAAIGRREGYVPDDFPNLAGVDLVAYDLETTGLRWWAGDRPVGVVVAWQDGDRVESRYLPFGHRGGDRQHSEEGVRRFVVDQLAGKTLTGLNLPFDAHTSREWGADLEAIGCRLADVGHRAALLDDHRTKFSLEAIAQDELGEGKVRGLDLTGGAHLYAASVVAEYARQDGRLPLRIYQRQQPRLAAEGLLEVAALEEDVAWPTIEMERNGLQLDLETLHRWVKETERELTLLQLRLAREAGFRVSPDSADDMARLFKARGIPVTRWTAGSADGRVKPKPQISDDVLEAMAASDDVVGLAREVAHLTDLRNKFLVPWSRSIGDDGILRFALHQLRTDEGGTVSGRYSASRAEGVTGSQVQQIMAVEKQLRVHCRACARGWGDRLTDAQKVARHRLEHGEAHLVRDLVVAADGGLVAASDADQVEYRIFAHLSNSARIVDAYRENPDLDYHELTGAIVRRSRPDFERKRVKNCNFAELFGAGDDRMAAMLGVSRKEAQAIRQAYAAALPEGRALMQLAIKMAQQRGYVRTVLGRRARFRPCKIHGYAKPRGVKCSACPRWHSALNRAVQGSAADVNKKKLVEVHRERKRIGCRLRLTNHDEVVTDVPDAEAAARLDEVLNRQAIPLKVPIRWSTKSGRSWAEC